MTVERPDWGDGEGRDLASTPNYSALKHSAWRGEMLTDSLPVPVETNSAFLSDEEKTAILAEIEDNANGREAAHITAGFTEAQLENLDHAVMMLRLITSSDFAPIEREFEALPAATQRWVAEILAANPYSTPKQLAKTLRNKATLEHEAAMRKVGW